MICFFSLSCVAFSDSISHGGQLSSCLHVVKVAFFKYVKNLLPVPETDLNLGLFSVSPNISLSKSTLISLPKNFLFLRSKKPLLIEYFSSLPSLKIFRVFILSPFKISSLTR